MTMPPSVSIEETRDRSVAGPPSGSGGNRTSKEDYDERRVYEAMTAVVVSSLQEFLQNFQSTPDSEYVFTSMTREDFFPKFFRLANKLVDDCCQGLVKIIRSTSKLQTVREAPTPELAKRIRETAFKMLDLILAGYYGAAKKIEVICGNINKIRAAMERVAAGGSPKPAEGPAPKAEAAGQTAEQWATEAELGRQHRALLQAQTQAFASIVQYLKGLNELPEPLLAYACDKCFAGEVNYQLEMEQVAGIEAEIQIKLAVALETFARIGALAKQDVEQEQAAILSNIQLEKTHAALEQVWAQKLDAKLKAERRLKKILTLAVVSLLFLGALVAIVFVFVMTRK